MIRKLLLSVLAVSIVAGLLLGSNMTSDVTICCERVTQSVEGSVSMKFQIDCGFRVV